MMTVSRGESVRDWATAAALRARPRAAKRAGETLLEARACGWRRKPALIYVTDNNYVCITSDGLVRSETVAHVARITVTPSGNEVCLRMLSKNQTVTLIDPAGCAEVTTMVAGAEARWAAFRDATGLNPGVGQNTRLVGTCVYLGGHETGLQAHAAYELLFDNDTLTVLPASGYAASSERFVCGYADIVELRIEAPGRDKSGGGLGIGGPTEGMQIAAALNSVTTPTRVQTILRIRGRGWNALFLHTVLGPQELRRALNPVFVALGQHRATTGSQASGPGTTFAGAGTQPDTDLLNRLERLAALHAAGALTDAEFEKAKAQLLGTS